MRINPELEKFKDNFIKIETDIEKYIDDLENLYTSVYDKLPKVEEDIESTLNEMDILIKYFFESDPEDKMSRTTSISEILDEINTNFENLDDDLMQEKSIKDSLDKFYNQESGEGVEDLYKNVKKIEEKVEDVEITSINAIIYGAKLGDKGRGFVTITDEIIEISKKVGDQYNKMISVIDELQKWEQNFKQNINKILELTDKIQRSSKETINELFSNINSSLEHITQLLKNQKENIEEAIGPISNLMSSIQHQDIIRQSLENLSKCLKTGHETLEELLYNNQENDYNIELDKITFVYQILQLSEELIENIETSFVNAFNELNYPIENIREKMLELKEEESVLTDFLGGSGYISEDNVISSIFSDVNDFIDEFDEELDFFERETAKFFGLDKEFYDKMKQLNGSAEEIRNEVNFLKKFAIFTRIELARIDLEKSHFNEELTGVTENAAKVVHDSCNQISGLNNNLMDSLYEFENLLELNKNSIAGIKKRFKENKDKVKTIEDLISQTVQALGDSSSVLLNEAEQALGNLKQGEDFSNNISETKDAIAELKDSITETRNSLLSVHGLEDWEISKDHLNEIINNLTTHSERLRAKGVYEDDGVDVEAGTEGGDLTLF